MKSIAIKNLKEFEIKEIEEPKSDGQKVIIEVKKAGICGSDIHYWVEGQPTGLVLGHEYCGLVIDPGNRKDLHIGDRVTALPLSPCGHCPACHAGNIQYCPETWDHAAGLSLDNPGALAPKMAIRPDMVIKVPANISDEEVAMVEPTAVGLHAINLANLKIGDKVLIIGGGIIGLVSAMFAKKAGASYIAISETNKARGQKAVDLGVADAWFDAKDPEIINKFMQQTQYGFDVVIECCGNDPAVSTSLMGVKPGGKVVLVGVATKAITIPTVLAVMHEVTVQGSIAYTKAEFETCIELMNKKQIDVTPFISDTVSLEEVQTAYERLTSGQDDAIKILVDPNR